MKVSGKALFNGEVILEEKIDVSEKGELAILFKKIIDRAALEHPDKHPLDDGFKVVFDLSIDSSEN